jgi:hypothetical protein
MSGIAKPACRILEFYTINFFFDVYFSAYSLNPVSSNLFTDCVYVVECGSLQFNFFDMFFIVVF